ncbi:MAG: dual specificity protein phosphatase family protein, partial [Gammaproteobacteria bacterium]|nr:dual specificity protein phosphatase family protein [Gammaproteobacteria bacterium]
MARLLPDDGDPAVPLHIDAVPVWRAGGLLGMTICPGQPPWGVFDRGAARDMAADIAAIRTWGATILVSLMEIEEMREYGVHDIPWRARSAGMQHVHLPIMDLHVPEQDFEAAWREAGPILHRELQRGGRVMLHCYAGLGRTGTIAARMLVESGLTPYEAIHMVRTARPGA